MDTFSPCTCGGHHECCLLSVSLTMNTASFSTPSSRQQQLSCVSLWYKSHFLFLACSILVYSLWGKGNKQHADRSDRIGESAAQGNWGLLLWVLPFSRSQAWVPAFLPLSVSLSINLGKKNRYLLSIRVVGSHASKKMEKIYPAKNRI